MRSYPALTILLGVAAATLAGCDDPGRASYGDSLTDPQVPPRGYEDAVTWLAAGFYDQWNCESAAHPARPGSPHGSNRICSNDALVAATGAGPYPIGAAGVKEIFDDGGSIKLFALYRKVTDGAGGDTWYWYEGKGDEVIANAEGDDTCTGCHGGAPRDHVFTVVPDAPALP